MVKFPAVMRTQIHFGCDGVIELGMTIVVSSLQDGLRCRNRATGNGTPSTSVFTPIKSSYVTVAAISASDALMAAASMASIAAGDFE